ncbi:response regulator transcription factor, partial [Escherichia coli]|uniref:response regulator transcription factor n=1 Tax=Escherichia coli TaxID=562 RepID=UPI0013D70267
KIHVTEAASGIALYKALRQESYDIAVLDVNLPDISGFELARDLAPQAEMGIIMLTARTGRDDRVRGYADGADLYLTKPVDSEELALAIVNL